MSRTNRVVILLTDEELRDLEESIEIDAKEKGARRKPATNVAVRDLIYEFVDKVQQKKAPDLFSTQVDELVKKPSSLSAVSQRLVRDTRFTGSQINETWAGARAQTEGQYKK